MPVCSLWVLDQDRERYVRVFEHRAVQHDSEFFTEEDLLLVQNVVGCFEVCKFFSDHCFGSACVWFWIITLAFF